MSKAFTALAVTAAGAATYMWLKDKDGTKQIGRQVSRAVEKARGTSSEDVAAPDQGNAGADQLADVTWPTAN